MKKLIPLAVLLFLFSGFTSYGQSAEWVKSWGAGYYDITSEIVYGPLGYIYVTGVFEDTTIIENDTLVSEGKTDIFIVKTDTVGNLIWVKQIGGSEEDASISLAIGHTGNIYLFGSSNSNPLNFYNDTSITYNYDLGFTATHNFIAKLDTSCNLVWINGLRTSTFNVFPSFTIDTFENLYLNSVFRNTLIYGQDTLIEYLGDEINACILKFNKYGAYQWYTHLINDFSIFSSFSFDATKQGDICFLGNLFDTLVIKSTIKTDTLSSLNPTEESDVFIFKIDSDGNMLWLHRLGGKKDETGSGLVIDDKTNDITISGSFNDTVDFDLGASEFKLIAKEPSSIFLVQMTSNADFKWASDIPMPGNYGHRLLTRDKRNNIYIAGIFEDTINTVSECDKDSIYIASNGYSDIIIQKVSDSGKVQWTRQLGGAYKESIQSFVSDDFDGLFIAGIFRDSLNLEKIDYDTTLVANINMSSTNPNSIDHQDIFLLKLNTNLDRLDTATCDLYISPSGETWTQSGVYKDTVQSVNSCDCIYEINLETNNSNSMSIVTSCGVYTWNGDIYDTTGIYYDTILNNAGCDSFMVLDLTIQDTLKYIKGVITTSNASALPNTLTYLVGYDNLNDSVYLLDSTFTDVAGMYQFNTYAPKIYLKVIPDSVTYPNEMPTYFDSTLTFLNATPIIINSCDTEEVNIKTIAGQNPGGPGFIGGNINEGAGKVLDCDGTPVSSLFLILMNDQDKPMTYTQTNAEGNFSFANLPLGTYYIWADDVNIDNSNPPEFTITNESKQLTNIVLKYSNSLQKCVEDTTSLSYADKIDFHVIPNPTKNELNISGLSNFEVRLTDLSGHHLMYTKANGKATLYLSGLDQGIYMLEITQGGNKYYKKVIKN